ncbi:MAG TPA: glycosyltransferase family 2 protein [Solirubrobacteraceae bacterium]|jgi:glycosyltransferase involved in cell wall biosynthesis
MSQDGAPELSILMPVYNEAARIERALAEVLETEFPFPIELVVVDDGSTDGTREWLGAYAWPANARLVLHDRNQGKGAAVRTGLAEARGAISAVFDADLEYEPADLVGLVEPVRSGRANAVFGVRAFDGYTSHSFWFVMGNRLVTLVANVLFNVYLRDLMTCHKAVRTDVFRGLGLRADGFTIEPEIAARLIQSGERIYEVPVRYQARSSSEGKKLTARDGVRVLATLFRCRLGRSPRR